MRDKFIGLRFDGNHIYVCLFKRIDNDYRIDICNGFSFDNVEMEKLYDMVIDRLSKKYKHTKYRKYDAFNTSDMSEVNKMLYRLRKRVK